MNTCLGNPPRSSHSHTRDIAETTKGPDGAVGVDRDIRPDLSHHLSLNHLEEDIYWDDGSC
ncbi:MAG TPA: hypothetical protein VL981_10850 [Candidatus Methylacidiphilales bacterium]|nr:hypothetical protein [Candidatus Methylacidiphilales bacterium]